MTFEELADLSVAIKAKEINYDYFRREFKLVVTPEYGYKERVKGKIFQIKLQDCIYFCGSNISIMADAGNTEFIVWGKSSGQADKKTSNVALLNNFLSRTINEGIRNFGSHGTRTKISATKYNHYYFQNVFGDSIEILASNSTVKEISK